MNNLFDIFTINYQENLGLSGMTDESFCLYVNKLYEEKKQGILVLCPTLTDANNLLNIMTSINLDTLFFPMDDFLTSEAISISPDLMVTRLETLNELVTNSKKIVITHMMGYLRYLPSKNIYQENILNLKVGMEIDPKELTSKFYNLGYKRETLVTTTGELGVRGFIIDIFPVSFNHPIRFEFFGDEIDSIRVFDEETQKSIEEIKEITIYPYTEFLLDDYNALDEGKRKQKYLKEYLKDTKNILDYLDKPITIVKDYTMILNTYNKMQGEIKTYRENDTNYKGEYMFPISILNKDKVLHYLSVDNIIPNHEFNEYLDFNIKTAPKFHENIDIINTYLRDMLGTNHQIIVCLKDHQVKNFVKYLEVPYVKTKFNDLRNNIVNIIEFDFPKGFLYQDIVILTDKDLFNVSPTKKKYKTKFKYATKISNINKLEVGDYIVHSINGIGIYNGIKTLTVNSLKKDFLEILYKGDDKLYIVSLKSLSLKN